jgi:hypothetical protein
VGDAAAGGVLQHFTESAVGVELGYAMLIGLPTWSMLAKPLTTACQTLTAGLSFRQSPGLQATVKLS